MNSAPGGRRSRRRDFVLCPAAPLLFGACSPESPPRRRTPREITGDGLVSPLGFEPRTY